jgi:hypothetical protein
VNRKNTLTGRLYKNDKAILGWETGNELDASFAWQHEIAGYIRSLDKNHLIIEGIRSPIVTPDEVSDPNFDVLTTHFYIPLTEATKDLLRNRELTKGKKPYFVGEFGYSSMSDVRAIVQTAKEQDVSGIMIWSMRGHRDEGGFYQHSEVFSGSYRFPGFPSGDYYHEKEVVDFMRQSAYNWGGENVPPLPKPEKPELLPISNVYEISWRGSVGATAYKIERKTAGTHEWTTLAENVSDADFAYRPLFSDTTAELGKSYVYRVSARNTSGISAPSKESAPVLVRYIKLFDDMSEPGKFADKSGSIDFIVHQDLFKAKQDNERIKASKGAYLIYKVPAHIDSIKVKLFFTTGPVGVDFSAADTSSEFKSVAAKLETFPSVLNFYNYFTPAEYTCAEFPPDSRMLKIKFNDDVQVGQVEIIYGTVPAIK